MATPRRRRRDDAASPRRYREDAASTPRRRRDAAAATPPRRRRDATTLRGTQMLKKSTTSFVGSHWRGADA